jgi:hypothetical protein
MGNGWATDGQRRGGSGGQRRPAPAMLRACLSEDPLECCRRARRPGAALAVAGRSIELAEVRSVDLAGEPGSASSSQSSLPAPMLLSCWGGAHNPCSTAAHDSTIRTCARRSICAGGLETCVHPAVSSRFRHQRSAPHERVERDRPHRFRPPTAWSSSDTPNAWPPEAATHHRGPGCSVPAQEKREPSRVRPRARAASDP